jgi:hypothetical protein
MTRFYETDLTTNPECPFARDASNKLVRRSYWLDTTDKTLVMAMTQGIGANLTNDEKRSTFNRPKAGLLDRSGVRSGNFATQKVTEQRRIRTELARS